MKMSRIYRSILLFLFIVFIVIFIFSNSRDINWYQYSLEFQPLLIHPTDKLIPSVPSRFRQFLKSSNSTERMIFVITPTYKRLTRMPDFTRLANTLSHISNLHWIVIEDDTSLVPAIETILRRTNLSFTYLALKSPPEYPRRGWYQRTMALKLLRENITDIMHGSTNGVVYFGDDDNSYDVKLFKEYIRNVEKVGMWGVGHVGGALVESPHVHKGVVVGFDAQWVPDRHFAIDMAGYALGLETILNSNAVFKTACKRGGGAPETCLLEDLGLTREDIQPFGFDKEENREVLVWHTKTVTPGIFDLQPMYRILGEPRNYGYYVEY